MKWIILFLLMIQVSFAQTKNRNAYSFLKQKSQESKPQHEFNEYEDIISGSIAFTIGNIGYFTTNSNTLKIAYSGVQTVGIIAVGHGIYDYYYPHFETRLLGLLGQKKMTRGELANGYVGLLGEMDRARRLSLLWSSSLLTVQYGLNAFLGDVSSDLKDIYLFLGGVNAIIATYSYFTITDYEKFYLDQKRPKMSFLMVPSGTGVALTKQFD